MGSEPPLRPWLRPGLDDARIARQWEGIRARLDRGGRPKWVWALTFAAAAALLVGAGVGFARWHRAPEVVASLPPETPKSSSLVLADGSHVTIDTGAEIQVRKNDPADVAMAVKGGGALFDVVPNHERGFLVDAAGVEVRVVGTQFRVELDPSTRLVTVSVFRGVVEVKNPSHPDEIHRLGAGESWATHAPLADATPSASASAPSIESAEPAASSPAPQAAQDEAKNLFDAANRARRAGDLAHATSLYRELVRKHPNDARAKVAALELARIEMDRGNSSVAEDALKTASSAEAGSSVHEDALARLVQLYLSKGDLRACREARARYLAAYPNGVHVAQVSSACQPP